jgi:thiamine-monophosphate kinase
MTTPVTPLGPGVEFDRIREIARSLGSDAAGLGDDCAFVPLDGRFLALSVDVSVDGVHFRRDWLEPEEIGWRAAAAALSDLAAVGATPVGVLVALTLPRGLPAGTETALMQGVGAVCRSVGAVVLGGDLTGGGDLGLSVTVAGFVAAPVRRSGARPGDGLWVTGALGGARAALAHWRAGQTPPAECRGAFARPAPRIAGGLWAAAEGATAMIDLSDGLAGDAAHLAAASGVGIDLRLASLPVGPDVVVAAAMAGEPPSHFAARGGEDYELLFTLPDGASRLPPPTAEKQYSLVELTTLQCSIAFNLPPASVT